jgi:hypothetical protein
LRNYRERERAAHMKTSIRVAEAQKEEESVRVAEAQKEESVKTAKCVSLTAGAVGISAAAAFAYAMKK